MKLKVFEIKKRKKYSFDKYFSSLYEVFLFEFLALTLWGLRFVTSIILNHMMKLHLVIITTHMVIIMKLYSILFCDPFIFWILCIAVVYIS